MKPATYEYRIINHWPAFYTHFWHTDVRAFFSNTRLIILNGWSFTPREKGGGGIGVGWGGEGAGGKPEYLQKSSENKFHWWHHKVNGENVPILDW